MVATARVKLSQSSSSNKPWSARALEILTRNPSAGKILILLAVIFLIWIAGEETKPPKQVEDDHQFFSAVSSKTLKDNPMYRCIDSDDDPNEWLQVLKHDANTKCECVDPLTATKHVHPFSDAHQTRLVASARYAASLFGTNEDDNDKDQQQLDLVMIGDSIIERFNGTMGLGSRQAPEHRKVFAKYFTRAGGGSLNAIALGAAGDTSNNLLWRLQNGLLPNNLRPQVWLIMVGTNDMGRMGCSKRMTLSGILNVAQFLHEQRPGATIIIHALMPRSDHFDPGPYALDADYSLGYLWKNILFVNREIKKFTSLHKEWIYMDANNLFLQKQKDAFAKSDIDTKGAVEINSIMMEDALHPTVDGYEEWAQFIVTAVEKHLEKDKNKDEK